MKRYLLTIAAAVALLAGGCSDDLTEATALRGAFIRTDLLIRDTTIAPAASRSTRQYVPMNGRLNLLGRRGGYEARTLVKFISASLPDRGDTVTVVSAQLRLRLEGWFGDSTGTFAFEVFRVTAPWAAQTARWDSLPAVDESVVRGSYTGFVTADTQVISVALDTGMVRGWLRPQAVTQEGILLRPATGCAIVRGIHVFQLDSVQFYPTLIVIARNASGTVQDTAEYAIGIDTFVGNHDDPVPGGERLFTQSGVVWRTRMTFDVSFIPRGAVVNSAELILLRDSSTSRLTRFVPDSTLLAGTRTSATDSNAVDALPAAARWSGAAADTAALDLRRAVQLWVAGTNHGLLLRNSAVSELSSFSLLSFYNERAADPAKRPALRIRYAVERRTDIP